MLLGSYNLIRDLLPGVTLSFDGSNLMLLGCLGKPKIMGVPGWRGKPSKPIASC